MKVLIIDDAKFQRNQEQRLLAELGHSVIEAVNGQEGYVTLMTQGADVVICDMLMPVMDGMAFLEMLKKHEIATPVVVLSADVQESTRKRCLELGARAFLNKPCRKEDLAAVLDAIAREGLPT